MGKKNKEFFQTDKALTHLVDGLELEFVNTQDANSSEYCCEQSVNRQLLRKSVVSRYI